MQEQEQELPEEIQAELDQEVKAITAETFQQVSEIYKEIKEFTKDEEQYTGIINDLVLFEVVLKQLNLIYQDTIYSKDVPTFREASDKTVSLVTDNFRNEFIKKTKEAKELPSLPDLKQMISWIEEIHLNLALSLFTEDFIKEVIAPAYQKISEAVVDVSASDIKEASGETTSETEESKITEEGE